MAKELPYFKFHVSEWLNGRISLLDYSIKGAFIDICALYWSRSGHLTVKEAKQRLSERLPNAYRTLEKNGFIVSENDFIKIKFLDEQFADREEKSKKNSKNGRLGGLANAKRTLSENEANAKPIREEKRREEKENIKHSYSFNQLFALATNSPYSLPEDRDRRMIGRNVDELVMELKQNGFDENTIIDRTQAMKAVYRMNNQSFPTKPETFISSFQARDWVKELKELDPERKAETISKAKRNGHFTPQHDEIGTSAPGSLG